MKKALFCVVTLCVLGNLSAQNVAEKALMLTGKTRYSKEVLAFYAENPMDTSRKYLHYSADNKLAIAFDPYDNYQTVFQVNISNGHKGATPLGLKWGQSESEAAALCSKSLATSPAYLKEQTQSLIVKGGIAILLVFQSGKLEKLYSIAATLPIGDWQSWRNSAYASFKDACISGDCKNSPSVYAKGKDIYVGKFQNGHPQGYGMYFYENGDYFHGTSQSGIRQKGVYFFRSGTYFSGEFNAQSQFSKGILNYIDGNKFEGTLRPKGTPLQGKMQYKTGSSFNGTFTETGEYEQGTLFVQGEGTFTGSFSASNKPKTGEYVSISGMRYRVENGVKKN